MAEGGGRVADGASGARPQTRAALAVLGTQPEDRRPDDLDRFVQVVDRPADPFGGPIVLDEPGGALQGHAGGEETLDRQVVQVTGDSVALLQQCYLLGVPAPLRQLQGECGLTGEGDERLQLALAERRLSRRAREQQDTSAFAARGAQRDGHGGPQPS